jgi:hypothetical protein
MRLEKSSQWDVGNTAGRAMLREVAVSPTIIIVSDARPRDMCPNSAIGKENGLHELVSIM